MPKFYINIVCLHFKMGEFMSFLMSLYLSSIIITYSCFYFRVFINAVNKKEIYVSQICLTLTLYSFVAPVYAVFWPLFYLLASYSGKKLNVLSFGEGIDKLLK